MKHKKYMHGWARVSVNKFSYSYRGCASRSRGHLGPQFYELKSYCDGVFYDYEVLPVDLTAIELPYNNKLID